MRIGTVHEETIHCPYCGQGIKIAVMPPDFWGDKKEVWFLDKHICKENRIFKVGDKVI